MLKIHKDKLVFDDALKERIEFICKFANKKVKFINGNIISIEKTNLHYVEPHRFIIDKHIFLFFNYQTDIFYGSLNKRIQLNELQSFLSTLK